MHDLPAEKRHGYLGTFLGALDVDGGPTDEQRSLVDALGVHVLRLHPDDVEPLDPGQVAELVVGEDERRMLAEGLVALELSRRPSSPAVEQHVHRYLTALGAEPAFEAFVRDHVHEAKDRLAADYQRIAVSSPVEPEIDGASAQALAARLDALAECPPGSLGRSFLDFYERHDFAWPVERPSLVRHDFEHVIAGYEPVAEGEIALQAMLTVSARGAAHYSGLMASLLLYEVGALPFPDIEPGVGALGRPGAADLVGEAVARGLRCRGDFGDGDHLAMADRDLAEVRAERDIEAPVVGPATFVV